MRVDRFEINSRYKAILVDLVIVQDKIARGKLDTQEGTKKIVYNKNIAQVIIKMK